MGWIFALMGLETPVSNDHILNGPGGSDAWRLSWVTVKVRGAAGQNALPASKSQGQLALVDVADRHVSEGKGITKRHPT
jgi:hypothetical protein